MDNFRPQKKQEASSRSPAWVVTFADMMSLLMCFFVLLLSFSEMDSQKYKQIAGTMKESFGVQQKINTKDVPKGTSIIAREVSPDQPDPAALNTIQQDITHTATSETESNAAMEDPELLKNYHQADATAPGTAADAQKLLKDLAEQVRMGLVEISTKDNRIIVRIRETGSFPSGSESFRADFLPVIGKLRNSLGEIQGKISIAGHTDNVPINTARFRSNWELSASRAVSVVHELLKFDILNAARFVVEGHGEAHPLAPNDTPENQALNRRVELTITQGNDSKSGNNYSVDDNPAKVTGIADDTETAGQMAATAVSGSVDTPESAVE